MERKSQPERLHTLWTGILANKLARVAPKLVRRGIRKAGTGPTLPAFVTMVTMVTMVIMVTMVTMEGNWQPQTLGTAIKNIEVGHTLVTLGRYGYVISSRGSKPPCKLLLGQQAKDSINRIKAEVSATSRVVSYYWSVTNQFLCVHPPPELRCANIGLASVERVLAYIFSKFGHPGAPKGPDTS
eukprot:1155971-Pelagomonas_calceolata.AAC.4